MEENRETGKKKTMDISVLSHEITYRRYLLNKGKVKDLFENISIPEYIALHSIARESEESSIYGQKTYLKMKPELRSSVAPVFMIAEHGKTVLVNYRIVGGYYVVDRIFSDGQLLVGTTKIKIRRR